MKSNVITFKNKNVTPEQTLKAFLEKHEEIESVVILATNKKGTNMIGHSHMEFQTMLYLKKYLDIELDDMWRGKGGW